MKEKIYFINQNLSLNQTVNLDGDEFHHLSSVMRSKVNDNIILFNGDSNFYYGKINSINKKFAEINIYDIKKSENEPNINLTVYQALAKGDKLSLVMQKITELGASKLCLFESKFCDVKGNTGKQERLDNISISASKQCGRASIVETEGILKLKDILPNIKNYDKFFVAYENETGETLTSHLLENKKSLKNVAIMIGAEGGFAEEEIKLLKENGAIIVSLGKRILRTETAAITCTALITQILESN